MRSNRKKPIISVCATERARARRGEGGTRQPNRRRALVNRQSREPIGAGGSQCPRLERGQPDFGRSRQQCRQANCRIAVRRRAGAGETPAGGERQAFAANGTRVVEASIARANTEKTV